MTDQQPYAPPPEPAPKQPFPHPDDRLQDEQRRADRHAARREVMPWALGLVLIFAGGALLLRNFNVNLPFLENWWALFILIPAVDWLANGLSEYRATGSFNAGVRRNLIGAAFFTLLAFGFLFGVSFQLFWPVMLILGGLSLLVSGVLR